MAKHTGYVVMRGSQYGDDCSTPIAFVGSLQDIVSAIRRDGQDRFEQELGDWTWGDRVTLSLSYSAVKVGVE